MLVISEKLKQNKLSVIVLAAALLIFIIAAIIASPEKENGVTAEEYAEYETARVVDVLTDSTEPDPASDNAYRGEQLLIVEISSGQYKGERLQAGNYVAPLYGVPVQEGDRVTLIISTYADGSHNATVYEFDREPPVALVIVLFILATILVGGKTGAKSLVGLILTVAVIFCVLIPLLLRGSPTLLTVFLCCAFITVVSFTVLGGISRKTVCAMLGTVAGVAIAMLFGLIAQKMCRINGLRTADVEPLLQLRQTGTPIGLKGLLVGGIIISALGAVMDVAMSIASAMTELHTVEPRLGARGLFRSGMNIGRDMVGTMTNTLILAFLGSGFTLIIYLQSLGLQPHLLLSSAYLAIEVVSGISSSIGVILSVPITAFISSVIISKK